MPEWSVDTDSENGTVKYKLTARAIVTKGVWE